MNYVKIYMTALCFLLLLLVGLLADNEFRGRAEFGRLKRDLRSLAPLMVSADTALNNSARYIRHYGLAYPGSAFSDFPGQRDYLPAGMAWAASDFPGVDTKLNIEAPHRQVSP